MYVWMDGTDGWMDETGWKDGWVDGWMELDIWMSLFIHPLWIDVWMELD